MLLMIDAVLDAEALTDLRARLEGIEFIDGRATAGWHARLVKQNRQARSGPALAAADKSVAARLLANPLFDLAVRPKRLTPLLFSRYGPGEGYGSHVDDVLTGGLRRDVSFTLFLSDPDSYAGGELVIESTGGEEHVKLPAGSLVLYPATTLHRVEPVTDGERQVAVGWARSYIRSAEQRELLFDLDTARRQLFRRDGKSTEFDLISKSTANLLRMWAED